MSLMRFSFLLSLAIGTLLFSCKKESNVGSSLISNDSKFYGTLVDTLTVNAYTEVDTVLTTENRSRVVIGELNDPEFGITKAQWYAQFLIPTSALTLGSSPQIDSVVLSFYVDTTYHAINGTTTFRAYELSNDFTTGTYKSNQSIAYGSELGNTTVARDSGVVKIKLSNNFGQKILNATGDTLTANATFLKLLKGISIKGEENSLNSNEGALFVVNPSNANTKITLYYNATQKAELKIISSSRHFVHYAHDFSGTGDLKNQLSNGALGQNRLFLKPLAGTRIILTFPSLYNWNKDKNYIIQRAELVLPVEANSYTNYRIPSAMGILKLEKGTEVAFDDLTEYKNYDIPSYTINGVVFYNGGRLENDKYRFLLTKFINDQALKSTTDTLVVNSIGSITNPYRTIFAGTNQNNSTRTKLLIYYTK
jgi:hypothetical protein